MTMRRPGAFVFRDGDALDLWLSADDGFLATFHGATATATGWDLAFELSLDEDEDEDGDDDDSQPLWLVPAVDRFQRVTLRVTHGTFEEDFADLTEEDRAERPVDGWLVDEWHIGEDPLSVRFVLREVGAPELLLTSADGSFEIVVDEPATRPASLSIDPDVVRLTFGSSVTPPAIPAGAQWRPLEGFTYELRRGSATPEAFVEELRELALMPSFRSAASGDETFERDAWLDYVTPHRRPWT